MKSITLRALQALAFAATVLAGTSAHAQPYPSKPIRIIAPVPPGGGVDLLSRTIGQKMAEILGATVVVENKPGGNGNIGFDYVAKATPDGYTLVMAYSAVANTLCLHDKIPYDPAKDFAPVVFVGYIPLILVANPSFPPNSVQELIAAAKAKPGAVQYAHGGTGAGAHLSGELFRHTGTSQTSKVKRVLDRRLAT